MLLMKMRGLQLLRSITITNVLVEETIVRVWVSQGLIKIEDSVYLKNKTKTIDKNKYRLYFVSSKL